MRTRTHTILALLAGVTALAVAGGRVLAATSSNYWNSTSSGNFTNDPNWNVFPAGNFAPTNTLATVFFTNRVASGSAYTVKLTKSVSTGPLNIQDDSVTFDLGGFRWDTPAAAGVMGTNATPAGFFTVKFSSSSITNVSNGNVFNWGAFSPSVGLTVAADTKLVIDDSLGFPVIFDYAGGLSFVNGDVLVSGTNSEFHADFPNSNLGSVTGKTIVTNKAVFSFGAGGQNRPLYGTLTFYNSLLSNTAPNSAVTYVGTLTPATIILSNNSTWLDGTRVLVGGTTNPGRGDILADNSTIKGNYLQLGEAAASLASSLKIINGSAATFTNGLWIAKWNNTQTNQFVLNNSSIVLGVGATKGYITNSAAMFATGTISGQSTAGNALVYNNGTLRVGDTQTSTGLGTLVLNKADLKLDANSKTFFEFSHVDYDRIVASNGFVSLLGTNQFALAAGAPSPVPGVKYGLGVYDFVIGTSITNTPQRDNLVFLLTNNYNLVYGVDFTYGVVSLGGGLFALELAFVPEPSVVMLLGLGGLMIWRRCAKRRTK